MTSQSRFSDNIVTGDYRRVSDGIVMSTEHKHPYYELSVVLSGRLEIRGSSDFIKTDAPCVIFHFPGNSSYLFTANTTLSMSRVVPNLTATASRWSVVISASASVSSGSWYIST